MKSLLRLLIPLLAVFAVNGLYFPENGNDQLELELRNSVNTTTAEPSGDCESNGGECKKNKKQCKGTIDTENTCSKNGVCCIVEVKAQGASELMLQMLTNTILIQGMAVQTLKEDQENSMKNLTNAIANLKMAGEIKASNLSDAISNQGMALKINQDSIMSNLSDAISNQGMVLQINQNSIMSNLSDGFSDQENMIESIEDIQDIILSNLTRLGCPEGFLVAPVTRECFKFFNDTTRSWTAAKAKCQSEGLLLAETDNPVSLRKYLLNSLGTGYNNQWTWIGGKGDGSYVRWQSDYSVIPYSSTSAYWHYRHPSSSYCLAFTTNRSYLSSSSSVITKPYYTTSCTSRYNTLCEYV